LLADGTLHQLTDFNTLSYDPTWSPVANTIAFVSPVADGDEIYTINTDGTGLQRLTVNTWEWDKHPSWSPNGSQFVFWSNRETSRRQIWIMNADGSNPRNLSNNPYNDWDPVWIK
jgi:TolB protein